MAWRGNNDLIAFEGPATDGGISISDSPSGESNVLDMRVSLDMPNDTAYFLYKNPSESSWTTAAFVALDQTKIDSITRVGISSVNTDTGWSSFELVPGPSNLAERIGSVKELAGEVPDKAVQLLLPEDADRAVRDRPQLNGGERSETARLRPGTDVRDVDPGRRRHRQQFRVKARYVDDV